MSPRLAFAVESAVKAGKLTLAHFQTGVEVDLKADDTPVTIADRKAERLLRDLIGATYPSDHVLGEEEGGDAAVPNRWVLDPIDGTKSFISGVPLYATLVSYEERYVPRLGVAYFPALNELVWAEVGAGAYWNGRPCRVSPRRSIEGSILCCGGHKTMLEYGRWPAFARLAGRALATRSWGDAYGHALVATGRVDAMLDPSVSRWDLSAVSVIVEEAGGRFTDFKGGPGLKRADKLEAISSNGYLHELLVREFLV